jgi:23S rRNA-/tRNA-specific pseudouridylate synthase
VTGVMHQIRAHVSDCGWPVVGDAMYGGSPSTRLWLHAWKIELPFPDGSVVRAEAPLPSSWPT